MRRNRGEKKRGRREIRIELVQVMLGTEVNHYNGILQTIFGTVHASCITCHMLKT